MRASRVYGYTVDQRLLSGLNSRSSSNSHAVCVKYNEKISPEV